MLGFPMNFSQQPYFDQWDYLNLVELVFGRIQLGKVCVSPKSVPHVPLLRLGRSVGEYPEKTQAETYF